MRSSQESVEQACSDVGPAWILPPARVTSRAGHAAGRAGRVSMRGNARSSARFGAIVTAVRYHTASPISLAGDPRGKRNSSRAATMARIPKLKPDERRHARSPSTMPRPSRREASSGRTTRRRRTKSIRRGQGQGRRGDSDCDAAMRRRGEVKRARVSGPRCSVARPTRAYGSAVAPARDRGQQAAGALLLRAAAAHARGALGSARALNVADLARRDRAESPRRRRPRARRRGQLSLPQQLNDLGRPQLPFTSIALGFKMFGLHEWAGRAPLALWGVLGVARDLRLGLSRSSIAARAGVFSAVALDDDAASSSCRSRTMLGDIVTMSAVAMAFGGLAVAVFDRGRRRRGRTSCARGSRGSCVGVLRARRRGSTRAARSSASPFPTLGVCARVRAIARTANAECASHDLLGRGRAHLARRSDGPDWRLLLAYRSAIDAPERGSSQPAWISNPCRSRAGWSHPPTKYPTFDFPCSATSPRASRRGALSRRLRSAACSHRAEDRGPPTRSLARARRAWRCSSATGPRVRRARLARGPHRPRRVRSARDHRRGVWCRAPRLRARRPPVGRGRGRDRHVPRHLPSRDAQPAGEGVPRVLRRRRRLPGELQGVLARGLDDRPRRLRGHRCS